MKKAILICILIIAVIATSASAKYSGGTGEPNTPYQIADTNDLLTLSQNTADHDKYIILIADINLANHNLTASLIPNFKGNFNGDNHAISNIYINSGNTNLGFFGQISTNAVIENLSLENINIENLNAGFNTTSTGCLGGTGYINSTVNNCKVTGSIAINGLYTVSYCGGLIGQNSSSINNCCFQGTVINKIHGAGGLVGRNLDGAVITNSITNCYVESTERTGGFVGSNYGYISNCFATADVNSPGLKYYYADFTAGFAGHNCGYISNSGCIADISCPGKMDAIGGFAGLNFYNQYSIPSGIIENCYCQSNIDANDCPQVGGFIGNSGGDRTNPTDPNAATGKCVIENCYSATTITLDDYIINAGGFAGANFDSRISSCYWNRSILTPQITQSIAYDVNSTTENLIGLNTTQMKTQSSFISWDFINVWGIGENQTYPFLRRYQAADLNHDGIVNFTDFAILANNWLK